MTDEKDHARDQAQAQFDSIKAMVERLEHCRDCDGEDCELTDEQIYNGLNMFYDGKPATDEDRKDYHDEDRAREMIEEDPLSIEVRSGWHTPGEGNENDEYMILLCTGGPAVRIIGDLNRGQPETAKLQYQDWGTPWTEFMLKHDKYETLLAYAQQFYFGD